MSTDNRHADDTAVLPALDESRIDAIEEAVFTGIARDRDQARRRRGRRTGWWVVGGAAAAVVVVAAVLSPAVGTLVAPGADSGVALEDATIESAPMPGTAEAERGDAAFTADATARAVITTASATVRAADVEAAVDRIGTSAADLGGHVEAMRVGSDGPGAVDLEGMTVPSAESGAWITVRVPADRLDALMARLSEVGTVTATAVDRQDVTTATIDLEARVAASQASVDRLTALLAQAQDVSDLIAAETALADRQAQLESYRQQLEWYRDQVASSTLTVTVEPDAERVSADPAGFGDGLTAGWSWLVAAANGVVVALGFLLPWVAVAAIAALVVWGVVRLVRRRRSRAGGDRTDG
ncbi:DUF4349 domain-containing protein [Microbacterium sp. GXF7504]